MNDVLEQFRSAIVAAGLEPPNTVHADGAIHRFASSGKRGDDAGWYILHTDGVAAGSFGCWRQGLTQTWCSRRARDLTHTERNAHLQRITVMREQRDAEQRARHQQAQESAATLWRDGDDPAGHPYLVAKGVKAHGIKVNGDKLLVPMRDTSGQLHSLQTIDQDGAKRFLFDGRVKGCYFSIGKPVDNTVIVCEGYATGASIHEATEHAVAVAFNAGNLEPVAQALREKFPAIKIVIAADDDWRTEGNPGVAKATVAALAVGGLLAIPTFPEDRPDTATDLNDLHRLAGAESVRACIESASQPQVQDGDIASTERDGVILVRGDSLTPQPVAWLWKYWLAQGKLHILAGAPGQGKTTIAIALAATCTVGGRFPDGSRCTPGNVLIWSGEDDPADTLLPRLIAAGADKDRVYFVAGARISGDVKSFDPARDIGQLLAAVNRIGGISLLIVDPVVSAVAGDSHKNGEVRRALQPLVDLASACCCAVLGISHFAKGGQGQDPTQRVVGSVAFAAVARVVLVAAKVKGEGVEQCRILARSKSNIGPDDGGFEYTLEQVEALPGIQASRVLWGKAVEGTARELLADPTDDADGSRDGAADFLREVLASGRLPVKSIQGEATAAGYSWRTVQRAADNLQIIKKKGGMNDGWYWQLPKIATKNPKIANVEEWSSSAPSVDTFAESEEF